MGLVCPGGTVFDSISKLRHLPFFDFAASQPENSPAWREATAGLVVMRLVDTWLSEGRPVLWDDGPNVIHVRAAIEDIDEGSVARSLLGRVMVAMQQQDPDIHCIVKPLMAYGRALEYDAHWQLAADVYETLLAHLHPVEDSDASVAAHLRLGMCHRNQDNLEDALAAFASASDIALNIGDIIGVLRARIGEANVAVLRGNIPKAEQLLDDTIAQARGENAQDVRSRALHDRANVARMRGNFELAVQLAYQALSQCQGSSEKDRILGAIAAVFIDLGVYSAARDAYLVLSATAQEQYVRWASLLNLMEIASLTGAQTQFEQLRRALVHAPLPPHMLAHFELNQGEGYYRLGSPERARQHLERAAALAGEHSLNELLFAAYDALEKVKTPAPVPVVERPMSLEVEEVAQAILEMRELVGVT